MDGCQADVEFHVESDHAASPGIFSATATVTPTGVAAPFGDGPEYQVVSARAPMPPMDFSYYDLAGMTVTPEIEFSGCTQALFDSPAIYQGLPFIDFPYAYIEKSLDAEWTSTDDHDATTEVCGDDGLCIHPDTFNAR